MSLPLQLQNKKQLGKRIGFSVRTIENLKNAGASAKKHKLMSASFSGWLGMATHLPR
jgi:hypothetical protein